MTRQVLVRTPCRLHFGLTSLGHCCERPQFGGVGLMVDVSGVELEIVPSNHFQIEGPLRERVAEFTQSILHQLQLSYPPALRLHVKSTPRQHTGLGVGSQLALAVAAGLAQSLGLPWRDPTRLCQLTGRGRRSAVGTYGFLLGGFIVDGGHLPQEPLGRLAYQKSLPDDWQIVLLTPPRLKGRSGIDEDRTIANLPPVSEQVTEELEHVVSEKMIPALERKEFSDFSESVYQFGRLAGNCFSAAQGGVYCSSVAANLVSWLRKSGFLGVGQSSWGPTIFAIAPNLQEAERLKDAVAAHKNYQEYEIQIGPAANRGVQVEVID